MKKAPSEINELVWASQMVALEYEHQGEAFAEEKWILDHFKNELAEGVVLDIGIGAGRTTGFLHGICADYTGIDYSAAMVELAQRKYPQLKLLHSDARDLSGFEKNHFDFVWFSFNGLDYVSHEDRLKILGEIYGVLKSGGMFVFSSHNRGSNALPAYSFKNIQFCFNPRKFAGRLWRYVSGIFHSTSLMRKEIKAQEYEIRNDPAQGYKLLTYYIDLKAQVNQLSMQRFITEKCLGENAEVIDPQGEYTKGYNIHYVARKL